MRPSHAKSGTVIIIVVALASMLSALALSFMVQTRNEGDESNTILQEAQARIMLTAALQHLLESQRLGWGEETYGWTDQRTGWPGPLGPVQTSTSSRDMDGNGQRDFFPESPGWWNESAWGVYPPPADFPYEIYDSPGKRNSKDPTDRDVRKDLRWPAPGSVLRGDTYVMQRPPRALQLTYSYNPVPILQEAVDSIDDGTRDESLNLAYKNGVGALEPQPLMAKESDFNAADTAPMLDSVGLSWFRIYRETRRDKDGVIESGGLPEPYYDLVAYPEDNHSTFIIACGAGASRGYRFWNLTTADQRALEAETAEESGLFANETFFNEVKSQERVLWFRVEVTTAAGGAAPARSYSDDRAMAMSVVYDKGYKVGAALENLHKPNYFGSVLWVQRLEKAPENW